MHIAYAAGFFDGEGCVVIAKRIRKRQKTPEYVVVVTISQKVREPLEKLQEMFGGGIYENKSAKVWAWAIASNPACAFLKKIRRHLWVKRQQADLVIAFQRRFSKRPRVTPKELAYRDAVRAQLARLK